MEHGPPPYLVYALGFAPFYIFWHDRLQSGARKCITILVRSFFLLATITLVRTAEQFLNPIPWTDRDFPKLQTTRYSPKTRIYSHLQSVAINDESSIEPTARLKNNGSRVNDIPNIIRKKPLIIISSWFRADNF